MSRTPKDQMITLREAMAIYLSPENPKAAYQIIDDAVNGTKGAVDALAPWISPWKWTIRALQFVPIIPFFFVQHGYARAALLGCFFGLVITIAAIRLDDLLHVFGKLIPKRLASQLLPAPHPQMTAFMDRLAAGEIKAYPAPDHQVVIRRSDLERMMRTPNWPK